jgi:hypothetical protein
MAIKRATRDSLAEYFARKEKIAKLRREANDLAKLQGDFEDEQLGYVQEQGGPEKCVIVCGYRLLIKTVNCRVEWQKALMKELAEAIGDKQAAKRAEAIREEAGTEEKLEIEPPG